jgi:5-methylcytosine-specific restriction endonuclease McrA
MFGRKKTKTCSNPDCQKENPQPLGEFWNRKESPDGLYPRCKSCLRKYRANPEVKQRESTYSKTEKRKSTRKSRRNKPENKKKEQDYAKEYNSRPEVKDRRKKQRKTDTRKSYEEEYRKTDARKQSLKKYNSSDKRAETNKKYLASDKGKRNIKKYVAKRMALRHSAEGSYTQDEWEALCVRYDYKCLSCRKKKPLTVDHIKPLSKGGTNYIDNIQPLCKPCNSSKGNKTIDYR